MRRILIALLGCMLFATMPLFANTVSVNGTCLQGDCANPDVLPFGGSTSGTFAGSYTFGNGDMFSITGSWNNFEASDGSSIEIYPIATVTFIGNMGGPSVGNDFMDMPFVQGYTVSFTSGVFSDGIFGSAAGGFGAGSTLQFLANINGMPLSGSGLMPLPGSLYYYNPNNPVNGITNPLYLTFEYQMNFGVGTQPGAVVYIDQVVPEPSSLLLLASGLVGGLAVLRRKLA